MNEENENIVLYVRGGKVFEGSIYDANETFKRICEDDAIYDMFFRFCNSFGDPLVEEGDSAQEVGATAWRIAVEDYEYFDMYEDGKDDYGYSFYEDFTPDYHYNDPSVECFMAFEEISEKEQAEQRFDNAEKTGFKETFSSPYNSIPDKYNGEHFKVIRRLTENECDYECMPMWKIRFDDGFETDAFPEEIIQEEGVAENVSS